MLKQLSRLKRTRSLIIVAAALLMGLSLVVAYGPGGSGGLAATAATNREVLARVDDEEITVGDLVLLKETYQQMFGGQFSMAQLGGDRRLLDGLIRDRVIAEEAARLGLAPTDAEVAKSIRDRFRDSSGKFVGVERYKDQVASRFGSVERFERQVRDSLATEKLRAFTTAGVQVSEQEVEEEFKRENTSFDLVHVVLTADKLAPKIELSESEIRDSYEKHKTDFRYLTPQKKIRYLFIDQAKIGEKLEIPDDELRAEYDKLAPENKEAGVRAQQIVLKIARPDLESQVSAKAAELVQGARAGAGEGGVVTEQAFAELARGNSEDPATAKAGGQLPVVARRNLKKTDDPLHQLFTMQPGEVSAPVKYGNAYFIFRRGDSVPKTFEDARRELLVSLRNRRGYGAAAQLAARAAERLKETRDPQKVAQELAQEARMSPAEMVRETDYIKPGDDVPNIGSSPQFEQAVQPLNEPNDVGDRTPVKGGFAIPLLVDKKDPRIPDFEEVKDKVTERARQDRAREQVEQAARDLAGRANSAGDLRAVAEQMGLKAEQIEGYKLGGALGEAGTSPAVDQVVNSLKPGEVAKTPLKITDSWVVVGITKRTEADLTEFAKQRNELVERAQTTRRNQVFEDYVAAAQERMQRGGDIKIYEEVFAKLPQDEAPPTMTRLPPMPPGGGQ